MHTVLMIEGRIEVPPPVLLALRRRFDVSSSSSPEAVAVGPYDVAVLGPDLHERVGPQERAQLAVLAHRTLALAAAPSVAGVVRAIRAGISDIAPLDSDPQAVVARVAALVEDIRLEQDVRPPRAAGSDDGAWCGLIGESTAMVRVKRALARVAFCEGPVLLTGPKGAGKEAAARALHAHGPRRGGPFVSVSPGISSEARVEHEIFGRLAPGGDPRSRTATGCLLLHEVAELSPGLQQRLAQLLAARARSAGVAGPEHVRLFASTSRDLPSEVAAGRFSAQLQALLDVSRVELPALRERGRDVLLLARQFVEEARTPTFPIDGLTPEAARLLQDYDWPGNVRELRQRISAASASAAYDRLRASDLRSSSGSAPRPPGPLEHSLSLKVLHRRHILSALDKCGGNKALAARSLGVNRKTLYRKLREYASDGP